MGEVIQIVLWNIAANYGAEIVNFTEQIVDQLETELVTDGVLTSTEVANLNNYLKAIFPSFLNLGATNTGATTGATTGGINIYIIPTPGYLSKLYNSISNTKLYNDFYNQLQNVYTNGAFIYLPKELNTNVDTIINYILVNFPPTNTSTPYTSSATTTGGCD